MAELVATRGTKLLIMLGDGGSPEDFAHPCSINASRDITFEKNMNEEVLPDCDDPDAPGWVTRDVVSKSCTVEGAGTLDKADLPLFEAAFDSADPVNAIVALAVAGGRQYSGKWHLSSFRIGGDRGAKTDVTITLVNDGAIAMAAFAG